MELSKKEFDVLLSIYEEKTISQRSLATKLNYSLGTINKVIKELTIKGFIDHTITNLGLQALEPYKVKRAIFLAAGFGSRLVPITLNTPKPLVRVNGVRIIDTLIDAVIEAGIEEIIIVRGYLLEQFDQLKYKYPNIKFVDNLIYNESNNISSAFLVKDLLKNAYMFESDLLLNNKKLIRKYEYSSNFLGIKTESTNDWCFTVDNNKIITSQQIGGKDCYQMVGISYWNEVDGEKLNTDIEEIFNSFGGRERYWEQTCLVYKKENYKIMVRDCNFEDIVEIDTFNELKAIDPIYRV